MNATIRITVNLQLIKINGLQYLTDRPTYVCDAMKQLTIDKGGECWTIDDLRDELLNDHFGDQTLLIMFSSGQEMTIDKLRQKFGSECNIETITELCTRQPVPELHCSKQFNDVTKLQSSC